ncbi:hypothetical protein WK13_34680 [Burkholderia ubonensis]|uniref:hypothetical protein n=1 Tax=Burkholderia ubonensis TaxID=101571 RepID=UPI0007569C98|nr:hypothetical protein [Burkholderia ubonensis]KVR21686.1 hypothetical protein WK13_34680 [Burkholderia ubonensis]
MADDLKEYMESLSESERSIAQRALDLSVERSHIASMLLRMAMTLDSSPAAHAVLEDLYDHYLRRDPFQFRVEVDFKDHPTVETHRFATLLEVKAFIDGLETSGRWAAERMRGATTYPEKKQGDGTGETGRNDAPGA